MRKFYNPYHFVPVEAPTDAQKKLYLESDEFAKGARQASHAHVTHERFVPDTLSGRLVVRLKTVTPTVVGGEQERSGEDFATVKPYKVDGRPAMPASSLRGLIGSVMEAASNGPLRVLDNRPYSYRKTMERALSAIGLVENDANGDATLLKPLCLPMLSSAEGGRTFRVPLPFRKAFGTAPPQFKVFIGDKSTIFDERNFPYRTARNPFGSLVTKRVKQLSWQGNGVHADGSLHVKNGQYAIAQRIDPDPNVPERDGVVRVLGCWGREEDLPPGKKHELWLPVPHPGVRTLKILPQAIECFHHLADERTEHDARLPFEPRDTRDRTTEKKIRLRAGDLVYFDLNEKVEVSEIALSAIWRSRVEKKSTTTASTAHEFFRSYDSELLPFSTNRKKISLVEQILGFTEETEGKESGGLSMASRIRFADALLPEDQIGTFEPPVPLKILGSPKLPCPALYFKPVSGSGYISKQQLDAEKYRPQGRKWYLHSKAPLDARPWATERLNDSKNQKNQVEPISANQSFFFHVDFDNLKDFELGLLLHAIEPAAKFHHKLGMGKPLGLGTVKLDVVGFFAVDRQERYSAAGLLSTRYKSFSRGPAFDDGGWRSRYQREAAVATTTLDELLGARVSLDRTAVLSAGIREVLRVLGDYHAAPSAKDVHYPTVAGAPHRESEHFKWFVFNDGHVERGRRMYPTKQSLESIGKSIPPLIELEWE